MNNNEMLNNLFDRMCILAEENYQEIPYRYFVSDDVNTAYAEYENRNPTVLATIVDGVFKSDF